MKQLPSPDVLADWLNAHPKQATIKDISKAFGLRGAQRKELRALLDHLAATGQWQPPSRDGAADLPSVTVMELAKIDDYGDPWARPVTWAAREAAPLLAVVPGKDQGPMARGDRFLGQVLADQGDGPARVRVIRRFGTPSKSILGIYKDTAEGGRVQPIDKGERSEWQIPEAGRAGARDGELVEATPIGPKARMGLPKAKIVDRLGDPSAPRSVSLIAIHQHGIPHRFPDTVLAEAAAFQDGSWDRAEGRQDLTDLPFVTIDPSDARDHDDAVFAERDTNSDNPDGHILWVAIADVANYVRPGSALDREARNRGNSCYFPDRVVPMLPDHLSGDLCSLHENVLRPALVLRMQLDADGQKIAHKFMRAVIKSHASLTYGQVQAAQDGQPDAQTALLMDRVITPLYACYAALKRAREQRQPLDLDLPERKVILDETGKVQSIHFADRFDAHRLIEEAMVLSNVAAAEELIRRRTPLLFRVHEEPSPEKLDALRETAKAAGLTLAKGQVLQTRHLNALLHQAAGSETAELINLSTLRSMTQAYYAPQNLGHFGLALQAYAHFTSPIRRYADLIVHRALIAAHGWGDDGLTAADIEALEETAQAISQTERHAMLAERDTTDRYMAAYLSERIGADFTGRISGIARFGLFVKLDETAADGLVPMRALGDEYFRLDDGGTALIGQDTGRVLSLGQRVTVRVIEAAPVTGGIALDLIAVEDEVYLPKSRRRGKPGGRGAPRGGARKAKGKIDSVKRKRERQKRR